VWVPIESGEAYQAGEYIRGLAKLEAEERDRCAGFATKAVAAGLAERTIRFAERQGQLMVEMVQAALREVDLSPEQAATFKAALARQARGAHCVTRTAITLTPVCVVYRLLCGRRGPGPLVSDCGPSDARSWRRSSVGVGGGGDDCPSSTSPIGCSGSKSVRTPISFSTSSSLAAGISPASSELTDAFCRLGSPPGHRPPTCGLTLEERHAKDEPVKD
jgi:hypothetical protein